MSNSKLASVVDWIKRESTDVLLDQSQLAIIVAHAGLFNDCCTNYGVWSPYQNEPHVPGLWQHPEEFAAFLIKLTQYKINSIIEVGAFYCYLSVLMTVYLSRFGNTPHTVAVDKNKWLSDSDNSLFKIVDYKPNKVAADYADIVFDLAFIDAEHTYKAVAADYENLRRCKLIAFHDINDKQVEDRDGGLGVSKFWSELKQQFPTRTTEFKRADDQRWMGIGLLDNNY